MFIFTTILYLWIAQAFTISALFAVIWQRDRGQRQYIWWSLGFCVHATGVLLVIQRGVIPDFLSIEVANTLALSSFFFWISGLRQCDNRELSGWAAVPALIWIAAMMVPDINANFALRVVTYGLSGTTGYLLLAGSALSSHFSTATDRRLLAGICLVLACNSGAFAVVNLIHAPQSFDQLRNGTAYGMIAMACLISLLVLGAKIVQDQSQQRLRLLLGKDPLTGVLNRRGMTEAVAEVRSRLGGREQIALLVFDLDHFKKINDTYGHQVGDAVLVEYASAASRIIGSNGVFSRSGGEEFTAIVPKASLQDAARYAETIRRRLADTPIKTDRGPISVTVSIGIAAMPAGEFDFDEMTRQADMALYGAKEAGRNRTAVCEGGKILLVPTTSSRELAEQIDSQADRQVAVLRRLSDFASTSRHRSSS